MKKLQAKQVFLLLTLIVIFGALFGIGGVILFASIQGTETYSQDNAVSYQQDTTPSETQPPESGVTAETNPNLFTYDSFSFEVLDIYSTSTMHHAKVTVKNNTDYDVYNLAIKVSYLFDKEGSSGTTTYGMIYHIPPQSTMEDTIDMVPYKNYPMEKIIHILPTQFKVGRYEQVDGKDILIKDQIIRLKDGAIVVNK
ncbi:MAG: hypothetical protein ACOYVK_02860 [Bacillota bacterium]